MGLTAIIELDNRSSLPVCLLDIDNPGAPGSGVTVGPGHTLAANMWIPWADSQDDYRHKRLQLQLGGITRYWIWQADRADGDHVRFTPGVAHLVVVC